MKRAARYYGKNEAATMHDLGLLPVPRSGAGWVHKEDGENDFLLCQLKSTDKAEARIRRLDLDRLSYHAAVSHKLPLFAIQFLSDGKIYFVVEKDKLQDVAKALTGKSAQPPAVDKDSEVEATVGDDCSAAVCAYNAARERFKIEQKEEFARRSAELKERRRQEAKKWKGRKQRL